jgi:PmbA protein
MFKNLIPANDLEFKYGINSPTILITKMTIAGK